MYDIEKIQTVAKERPAIVSQADMPILTRMCKEEMEKKAIRKRAQKKDKGDATDEKEKRNLEWTVIFDVYTHQSNPYCVFMYEGYYFTRAKKTPAKESFFMSFDACGQFSTCPCRYHATLQHDGWLKIDYSGNIIHLKNEFHARPVRGIRRQQIQELTSLGVTPGSLYLKQLSSMSIEVKEAGNRNKVGSSPSVIRKISSESTVKLRRDDNLEKSLQMLKHELSQKIFPGEQISGYLLYSRRHSCLSQLRVDNAIIMGCHGQHCCKQTKTNILL